ncbi:MAG: UPF0182 family protein [Acidimicrobiaceae bacterium]|nr:UPF0182 family protein [Acidimicrobiaceae bacterium]
MRTPTDMPRRLPRPSRRLRLIGLIAVVVLILLLLSLRGLARFWTDYLWFQSVHFTSVFRGVLLTKILLAVVFCLIFFGLMLASLTIADRLAPEVLPDGFSDELVERYRAVVAPHGRWVRIVTAAVFALFGGIGADKQWNNWDLFRYHVSFGRSDPLYHNDIGFYVFQLPFIRFLISWFFSAFVVILIVTAVAQYLNGGIRFQGQGQRVSSAVKTHLSVLLGILAIIKAVGYYFDRLALVLSTRYVVDGATATVVHATRPAKTLLIAIAIIAAALFLYNIRQKGWLLPAVAVGLWALVWVLVGAVYPAVYQALRVSPSEQTREAPYIQRNINATLQAYGLDNVQTQPFAGSASIQASQITGNSPSEIANQQTLANVRLLDPSVDLLNTFDKYQAFRTYYQFNSLSLDRYPMPASVTGGSSNNSQLTATISSVRELNNQVPSGFVNSRLAYTHGYGAVVAPISEYGANSDGTPNFTLSDLPPSGTPNLNETGSQVYYGIGSETGGYVIADSKTPELDYENQKNQQITTKYAGSGGVSAGGFIRRLAFALRFGDPNMVLSGQINDSSKVMYIRNIRARVQKTAPFLKYDADPYAVVLNNQIWWIQDAYTTTDNYPYAERANTDRVASNSGLDSTFNYVRNSVKVVINAYNGSMYFFVMDSNDPIIKVYERAFPDLFTPLSKANKLIPGITDHFRYPEDIFKVQTNMYGRYHLTAAKDFYTQSQAWSVSQDPGSGPLSESSVGAQILPNGQPAPPARLQPQYLLAHPPDETSQSFLILTPYVPVSPSDKQQNLTAFMTASSDPSNYGTLTLYTTPPGLNVDGPGQIANVIKSNTEISEELTLLNTQSSIVELGEVAVVPIDQTLLYVQPIYVESAANHIPVLKDVVVVYNGNAYHSKNASLDLALCQITNSDGSKPFGSYCNTPQAKEQTTVATNPTAPTNNGGSTPSSTTTTTTTPATTPTTTPSGQVPPPPAGATVSSLLQQATTAFSQAKQALSSGDLGRYQSLFNQAQIYVEQAQQLENKKPSG